MNEFEIKESWYLRNITIGILLLICSMVPFAAILCIPLIFLKGKRSQHQLEEKIVLANTKANEILKEAQEKLSALNKDIENKETLKSTIIADATANADNLITDKKQELELLTNKISDKEHIMSDIIKTAKSEAANQIQLLKSELDNLTHTKEQLIAEIASKKSKLVELNEETLMQDFALYEPMYDFINSENYKFKLDEIRDSQKNMIKNNDAATGNVDWTVNGSKTEGRKMVRDTQKLLLRAFNSECEHVTGKVKYNNFDSCKKRITNSYSAISKLGRIMNISINPQYYNSKIEELHLALEYQLKKQEEKEHQRELREQAREEARLKHEIAEARKKISKEKIQYSTALESAKKQLTTVADESEKSALIDKINELQSHLSEVDKNMIDIDYRESNQKAGYVYVISNIGSFGPDVYKIGMTRRLDPMERIYELSDASVPFNFDVHTMIFSDDAPKLEAALHNAFEDKKINMVNTRREFFKVKLDEIETTIKENFDGTVEFTKLPEAEQYRESLKIKGMVSA
jgi:hypothetical protein